MPRWFRVLLLVVGLGFVGAGVVDLVAGDVLGAVVHVTVGVLAGVGPVLSFVRPLPPDTPVPVGAPSDLTAGPPRPWIVLGSALVVLVVLGGLSAWRAGVPSVVPFYLAAIGVLLAVQAVRLRHDRVHFGDDALVVTTRAGVERYAWDDVLELSWSPTDFPRTGSGPVVRVRGGSFDVPGPTAPLQIAALPIWGRHRRAQAREQVRRAAAQHGIPFTDGLVQLIASGRRSPRLPGERS